MSYFLAKRLLTLLLTLVAASAIIFVVLEVLPGNAAQVIMGPDADPEAVAAKTIELGLDQPAAWRYLQWVGGLLKGDMGPSYTYGTSAWNLIGERLQLTLPLALMAMALSLLLALSAGLYAAARHRRIGDSLSMGLAQLGIAVPNFWFAILLILLFAVQLQWLPAGGFDGWYFGDGIWNGLLEAGRSLLLPAVALATVQGAILARFVRSSVLEVMHEDYVRTARAKGLTPRATLYRHVLRNAMIPVLTVMGLQFAELLAGTIVIENVFYLPGLGRLIFQSIANRDLAVVRNAVLLLAATVVVINFCVDLLYTVIDPRVRGVLQ